MKTSVERIDDTKIKLAITLEATEVDAAIDQTAKRLASEVRIPGFRPGRAPRRVLETRLGKDTLYQEAVRDALPAYYQQAVQAEDLPVVSDPEFDVDAFTAGTEATFTATVEVRPEVEPPDVSGLQIPHPDWELTDQELQEQIDLLRERFATLETVGRGADVGDQIDKTEMLGGWDATRERVEDLWVRLHKRLPEGDQLPSRYAGAMLPFIEYVHRCTAREDRLLMTGFFPEVYVMADRGFAGGHIAFQAGFYRTEADQSLTIARLERQSVPFVVMVEQIEPELRDQMPRLMSYVDERYQPMAEIDVPETRGVRVYVERDRHSRDSDPATGWPCFR